MPSIDDSIRKIDNVICRHLDNIDGSTRGAISQDILEQLMKLVNHIMLKCYADGSDIHVTEENIAKAVEYAQVTSDLNFLYKFRNYLQVVTTQFTLDEDGSERLMLKYYRYLFKAKKLLNQRYGILILYNLNKFPLRVDDTLQEYYSKIAKKITRYPTQFKGEGNNKYYIQKLKPLFVKGQEYFEVTFTPVDDRKNKSKTNRVIAFTRLPITSNYASKFHLVHESIEILGKTMPIIIIDGWEVSIRDCEFQNFISLFYGRKEKVPYPEQRAICEFLTKKGFSLTDLIDFPDAAFERITTEFKTNLKSVGFIPVFEQCRTIIKSERPSQNILRYLLHNMNNVIIKNQRGCSQNENLSNLFLLNGCKQFDDLPFNRSPLGHNPKLGAVFDCIPHNNRQPELFARFIRNNTEGKGQLFTDIDEIKGYKNIPDLIKKYNRSLWYGHKPKSNLILEHNQVFINEYKLDTCKIIKNIQDLSTSGIENYQSDVEFWLLFDNYVIDCPEKNTSLVESFQSQRLVRFTVLQVLENQHL